MLLGKSTFQSLLGACKQENGPKPENQSLLCFRGKLQGNCAKLITTTDYVESLNFSVYA